MDCLVADGVRSACPSCGVISYNDGSCYSCGAIHRLCCGGETKVLMRPIAAGVVTPATQQKEVNEGKLPVSCRSLLARAGINLSFTCFPSWGSRCFYWTDRVKASHFVWECPMCHNATVTSAS